VTEPQGQSDVVAQLNVECDAEATAGLYSVVIKAIDAPLAPYGESKPSDNAQRSVIKVWCGSGAGVPDSIEDANGLYARWTVFQSVGMSSLQIAGDLRKTYKSPPSLPSDTGYVERIVDLQCYWMDDDGCFENAANDDPCNDDGNLYIDEVESWDDYDLKVTLGGIAAVDADFDCVMNAAKAQPGHPVDSLDTPLVSAQIDSCTANVATKTATTITVAGCDPATYLGSPPLEQQFYLDSEALRVVSVAGQDVTVTRGWGGSVAAAHTAGKALMNVAICPASPYSEEPNIVVNTRNRAADQDCDGLVDGIERAWGSNPLLDDSDGDGAKDFVEIFQQTNPLNPDTDGDGISDKPENNYMAAAIPSLQCANNWDDDGDGKVNDGCPIVVAAETVCAEKGCPDANGVAPWDSCDDDTDGKINDGCAASATAEGSATSGEAGEAANLDDNCPGSYNPDQANNDGQRRDNGDIVDAFASNPNQDKIGDACDADDDNDGAPDAYELKTSLSNPRKLDSDGDTINDGAEIINGKNPMLKTFPNFPNWTDVQNQLYYRGCHINLPPNGKYGTLWDAEYDDPTGTLDDDVEMDIDGDTVKCTPLGSDPDSDNGIGNKAIGPVGYADRVEAFRYALGIANPDTDGDGCPDWVEITDLNGDRLADIGDVYIVAAKAFPQTPVTNAGTLARDLDADLFVGNNDVFAAALNSKLVRGAGPSTCTTSEN
jgi:hypothetical protein